jgi:hypothetical protein
LEVELGHEPLVQRSSVVLGFGGWLGLRSLLLFMNDFASGFSPALLVVLGGGFGLAKLLHLFASGGFKLVLGLLAQLVVLWLVLL